MLQKQVALLQRPGDVVGGAEHVAVCHRNIFPIWALGEYSQHVLRSSERH